MTDRTTIQPRAAKLSGRAANDDFWRGHDAGRHVELNAGVGGRATPLQIA